MPTTTSRTRASSSATAPAFSTCWTTRSRSKGTARRSRTCGTTLARAASQQRSATYCGMEPGAAAYDEVADAYHEALDPEGLGLRDPVFQQLLTDVAGAHVLALACGQGRDARLLADLGATWVGVDVSEHMLEYARRFEQTTPRGVRYVRGDAQDLEAFDDESFDGIVAHMALMDIPKVEATVGSVARVLRPGGWFVFSIVHPCYQPHVEIVRTISSRPGTTGSRDGLASAALPPPAAQRVRQHAHRCGHLDHAHGRAAGRTAVRRGPRPALPALRQSGYASRAPYCCS